MGKITYKIDRILSGSDGLQLGLKTDVALKVDSLGENKPNYLKLTRLAGYQTAPTVSFGTNGAAGPAEWGNFVENAGSEYATNKALIPTAGWVEGLTAIRVGYMLNYLESAYLQQGSHISITSATGNSATTPHKTISVVPLYSGNDELTTVSGNQIHTVAPESETVGQSIQGDQNLDNSTKFITGFETDAYGKVTKVYGRKVSTSDIGDMTNVDNYRSWGLALGNSVLPVESYYGTTKSNTDPVSANYLHMGSGLAIAPSLDVSTKTFKFDLQIDNDHFVIEQPTLNAQSILKLKSFNSSEQTTSGIYKTKIDTLGRITESTAIQNSDIMAYVDTFSTNVSGKVPVKSGTNTQNAANTMYFLNSDAQWVNIPYDKVLVSQTESNKTYSLLGVNGFSTSGNYSTATHSSAYFDNNGTIHGTFAGNGSALTNIDASHVVSISNSKIDSSILNISTLKPLLGLNVVDNANKDGQIVINTSADNKNGVLDTIPNTITSPSANTDVAVLSANMDSNGAIASTPVIGWRNLKTLITGVVAGEGGMRFMGVIGAGSGETAWSSVESSFKKGDFYKLSTIGTGENWGYAGYAGKLEAGDTMIAIKDKDAAYTSASDSVKMTYWSVIQSNLINAVTAMDAPNTDGTYYLPYANDSSMTHIFNGATVTRSDGNWTINATVDHAKDSVKLKTQRSLWGQNFDGTAPVAGAMTDVGTITPQSGENVTATIGTQAAPWTDAYITAIHGSTFSGTATTADHLVRPLILTFGSQTLTFDGSAVNDADRTFSFDIDALNIFDAIEGASTGTGNALTGVTIERKSNEGNDRSVIKYTANSAYFVNAVSDGLFDLSITNSGTNSTLAVAPYSDKQTSSVGLHFYTGNTLPSNANAAANTLKLEGVLLASKLQVMHDTGASDSNVAHDVISKRTDSLSSFDSGKKIIVSDTSVSGSSDYGIIASAVNMTSSINSVGATNLEIPTALAVAAYVDNTATAISAATKVECLAIPFDATTNSVVRTKDGFGLPGTTLIDYIDVVIDSAFANTATFTLSAAAAGGADNTIISNSEVDLSSGGDVYSYKFGKTIQALTNIGSTALLKITVSTSTASGAGTCYIYYTKSQVRTSEALTPSA